MRVRVIFYMSLLVAALHHCNRALCLFVCLFVVVWRSGRPNDYNPAMLPPPGPVIAMDVSKLGIVSSQVEDGPNKVRVVVCVSISIALTVAGLRVARCLWAAFRTNCQKTASRKCSQRLDRCGRSTWSRCGGCRTAVGRLASLTFVFAGFFGLFFGVCTGNWLGPLQGVRVL